MKYSDFTLNQTYNVNGKPFVMQNVTRNYGSGNKTVYTGFYDGKNFFLMDACKMTAVIGCKLDEATVTTENGEPIRETKETETKEKPATKAATELKKTETKETKTINKNQEKKMETINENKNNGNENVNEALQNLINVINRQNTPDDDILRQCKEMIDERMKDMTVRHEISINGLQPTKVDGVLHTEFENVLKWTRNGFPVYLFGEAGTGKNVLCEQVAKALDLPFYYAGCLQQKYELEGFVDATGTYQGTEFFKAFTGGGVFLFDEIDGTSAEVLVAFNAVLANGYYNFPGHGRMEAHQDFHIIAAGNTNGRGANSAYNGRFQLDASTLDRFAFIHLDYDPRILLAAANGDRELMEFADALRAAIKKSELTYTVSPRGMKRYAAGLQMEMDEKQLMKQALCAGWDAYDLKMLQERIACKNKYAEIFKSL